MESYLLHSDVFMPNKVKKIVYSLQERIEDYSYSSHIDSHIICTDFDRSHSYNSNCVDECISVIREIGVSPFEVEIRRDSSLFATDKFYITKYCCRVKMYGTNKDISVVIRPYYDFCKKAYDNKKNKIVTAWINDTNDVHATLDKNKYLTKEEFLKLTKK